MIFQNIIFYTFFSKITRKTFYANKGLQNRIHQKTQGELRNRLKIIYPGSNPGTRSVTGVLVMTSRLNGSKERNSTFPTIVWIATSKIAPIRLLLSGRAMIQTNPNPFPTVSCTSAFANSPTR